MLWFIIPACILLILIYVLVAPFFIELDTERDIYQLRFHHLATMGLILREDKFLLKTTIVGWEKEYDMLQRKNQKKQPTKRKKESKKTFSFGKFQRKAKEILKSFQVKKCIIHLNTGDIPLNGILYPWFYLLSRKLNREVMISFHGDSIIILKIENSIARMLWAFIKA